MPLSVPVDAHQTRLKLGILLISHDDTTGHGQVAIEPGVPETATVHLHTNLLVALSILVRDRLDLSRIIIGFVSIEQNPSVGAGLPTLRHGLSVCAAAMVKPLPGL